MTREQAKQNLISIGVAEPTDEQVTNYLNQVNGETKKEKDKAEQYKSDAEKLADVQKQLADLQNSNLTDIEKANKATEDALKRVAELEKREALQNSRRTAMEQFKVTSEQASQIVKDDGSFDYEALGKIISEKEVAAANAKEIEIAKGAPNPGGSRGNGGKDEKTEAEKVAESIGNNLASTNKTAQSVIDSYL